MVCYFDGSTVIRQQRAQENFGPKKDELGE